MFDLAICPIMNLLETGKGHSINDLYHGLNKSKSELLESEIKRKKKPSNIKHLPLEINVIMEHNNSHQHPWWYGYENKNKHCNGHIL